ncbi:UNVERIFIED_CONTAM: hypothetical protein GTU68_001193 [Idotea baltica]|nr:hypothetical protein [Idotea baltica]
MKANRMLLERLLGRIGYHTVEAADGLSALSQLEACLPDLVILDVEMPGIDGVEVVRRFRESEADDAAPLPIIIASGNPSDEMKESALEAGADLFLTKPFDFPVLLSEIRTMLRARRTVVDRNLRKKEAHSEKRIAPNTLSVALSTKE